MKLENGFDLWIKINSVGPWGLNELTESGKFVFNLNIKSVVLQEKLPFDRMPMKNLSALIMLEIIL